MKVSRLANGSPEVFRTLQGEGPSLGCPAVFVRLSLCNLHCTWCDTPYTWNWEGSPWPHQDDKKFRKDEQMSMLTPQALAELVSAHLHIGDRLVITGGEPLLQQNEIIAMLEAIPPHYLVEIETNGTQLPVAELETRVAQFNVSPKLANSGNREGLRLDGQALAFFSKSPKAFFKFVVTGPEDLAEIQALATNYSVPSGQILLMPEGRSPEALARNRKWLAEACLENNYRLTDRLHVQLWGDERGR